MTKMKMEVTSAERTMIVAALMAYGRPDANPTVALLAGRLADADPTNDGPEVEILSGRKS